MARPRAAGTPLPLFDAAASRAARDDGIAQVGAGRSPRGRSAWLDSAMSVVARLPSGWVGIGEDIRRIVLNSPAGPPHHPNAWGALIRCAATEGYLVQTGDQKPMTAVRSHARQSLQWRRL
jgi:hypothetical protein